MFSICIPQMSVCLPSVPLFVINQCFTSDLVNYIRYLLYHSMFSNSRAFREQREVSARDRLDRRQHLRVPRGVRVDRSRVREPHRAAAHRRRGRAPPPP